VAVGAAGGWPAGLVPAPGGGGAACTASGCARVETITSTGSMRMPAIMHTARAPVGGGLVVGLDGMDEGGSPVRLN
jgi:hypothetical protein